jgi:adenine deaminase
MFCSDDKHPDDLVAGHINLLIKRALKMGFDPMAVFRSCTLNPVKHYKLTSGLLQAGDAADLVLIDNLSDFNVLQTIINGNTVALNGKSLIEPSNCQSPNCFKTQPISKSDIEIKADEGKLKVIIAVDGDLVTGSFLADPRVLDGKVVCDVDRDILKITVINRYELSKPAVGFIKGFGLKRGAMASTVAHDSHNIICIGTNDADMVSVINSLIGSKGGIAVIDGGQTDILPLPVAGLMASANGYDVAEKYEQINKKAIALGGPLKAPFMTLSFMALLVIPELKLSDKGLFDGLKFAFTELFEPSSE